MHQMAKMAALIKALGGAKKCSKYGNGVINMAA
jgi:hypothetical protein